MKQKIISNQEYNNIIYLYNNVSIKEIAEQYKVSRSTIENILKDCNVITNRRKSIKIIEDNSQRIIDMYNNGISIKTIAKYFEVDKKTISNHLKNNNVVIQNNQHLGKDCYKINENFFDNFSTPNQAYILGLLYADGYCNSNKNMIRITLQEEDKELLEKIRTILNFEKPLYFDERSMKTLNCKNTYSLTIINKHLCNTLYSLGVVDRKSLILKFPTMSKELIRHFVRGYFDGDGHINNPNISRGCSINIVSSKDFCNDLSDYLNKLLNIHTKVCDVNSNELTKRIVCTKKEESLKFLSWIYNDAELYMDRKYKTYLTHLTK